MSNGLNLSRDIVHHAKTASTENGKVDYALAYGTLSAYFDSALSLMNDDQLSVMKESFEYVLKGRK